jgi:uncharacterized protein
MRPAWTRWISPRWRRCSRSTPPPEFLLLGTGAAMVHPPRAFIRAMEERGIGVEVMDSRAAARAWGILRSEERWIAAAIMGL